MSYYYATNYKVAPVSEQGPPQAYASPVAMEAAPNDNYYHTAVPQNSSPPTHSYTPPGNRYKSNLTIGSRRPIQLSECPNCRRNDVRTRTRTHASGATWACVAVGLFTVPLLCWIPLVVPPLKQTDHYCQQCGHRVGKVKFLESC